jgi:Cut12 conserved domain
MLSWLTGRAGHDGDMPGKLIKCFTLPSLTITADATFMDMPETPAHLFAVKAFKQALFGTPQPITPFVPKTNGAKFQTQPNNDTKATEQRPLPALKRLTLLRNESGMSSDPISSPSKPPGILMTPGTASGRRKQVKFGEKVVDNEGKRKKYSLSGLPDDCPGKFPSPFTPKIAACDPSKSGKSERSLDARLREVVDDKNAPVTRASRIRPTITHSKDDNDITTDLSTPTSASGRYWKSQYDMYSTRSEAELTRLIGKHRLVKDYARIKDEEVITLKAQLEADRRKRKERETSLEIQVRDLRERLRVAMAENAKMAAEMSALRLSTGSDRAVAVTNTNDGGILQELVDAGFRDVEIPISKRETSLLKALSGTKPIVESSGQDIWLDNDMQEDTFGPGQRRRLIKSTPAPKSSLGQPAPLSSKSIRERLTNPLALRSANIISKLPSQLNDKSTSEQVAGAPSDTMTPDVGTTSVRTPLSEGKASGKSIEGQRKSEALARIAERRKNRRLVKK